MSMSGTDLSRDNFYKILLARGVFKWFAVRRDIIKLKNEWKRRIRILYETRRGMRAPYMKAYTLGYLQAMEDCRKDLRALCHSERWQAPDNDRRANLWLFKNTEMPKVQQPSCEAGLPEATQKALLL